MERIKAVMLAACLTCLPALAGALAQERVSLKFGAAGIGSATYVYAAGMAEMVMRKLPAGSNIDIVPGTGSVGSVKLLQRGEIDLGTTHAVTAAEACGGFGLFNGQKQTEVRAVIGGLDNWYFSTFVTKKSGVTSWEEIIAGKNRFHLLIVPPGGAGHEAAKSVFAAMNTSIAAIEKKGGVVETEGRAGVGERIRDGEAQGWAHIVPRGHPGATQVVLINDMIVIPLPDRVIGKMVKRGWSAGAIPANTWKGQTKPVRTVLTHSAIVTRAGVPDHSIYTFTKTIMENAEKLPKIHAAFRDFKREKAADAAAVGGCPLHPGAAKYYKEIGLIK